MNFFRDKDSLKHLIISALAVIVVIVSSVAFHNDYTKSIKQTATFEKTDFDALIYRPSQEQVDDFEADEDVEEIVPYTKLDADAKGDQSDDINLMMTYDDYALDKTFFSDETVLQEDGDEGLILDERAADRLGVSVGQNVTIQYNGYRFEERVDSIHMPVNYSGYQDGVILHTWDDEFLNQFDDEVKFDHAFIDEADTDANGSDLLSDYIPLGGLTDFDTYHEYYDENHEQPESMSDSEWEEHIQANYDEYEKDYLDEDHSEAVAFKTEIGNPRVNDVENLRNDIWNNALITALLIFIIFLILEIILISSKKSAWINAIKHSGIKTLKRHLLIFHISIGAVANGIALASILYYHSSVTLTTNTHLMLILIVYSGLLLGVILTIAFIHFYINRIHASKR